MKSLLYLYLNNLLFTVHFLNYINIHLILLSYKCPRWKIPLPWPLHTCPPYVPWWTGTRPRTLARWAVWSPHDCWNQCTHSHSQTPHLDTVSKNKNITWNSKRKRKVDIHIYVHIKHYERLCPLESFINDRNTIPLVTKVTYL